MPPRDLLGNYTFIVILALFLGLLTGGFPGHASEITIVSLAAMMTLSLSNVTMDRPSLRQSLRPMVAAIILNYAVLTGLIFAISVFFAGEMRTGWVLLAAVPSAISVVPFSYMIRGDTKLALVGTAAIYLLALLVAPLIAFLAIGEQVDRVQLIYTLVLLIIVPLGISMLPPLRRINPRTKAPVINIFFGVLIFTTTGANREAFSEDLGMVLWLSVGAFIRTFGVGLLVLLALRRIRMGEEMRRTLVLFSSYKNLGLAVAMAFALVGTAAAIPPTICVPFESFWLVFLRWLLSDGRGPPKIEIPS